MASRLDALIRGHAERLDQLAGPIDLTDVTCGARNDTIAAVLVDVDHTPPQTEGRRRWPIVAAAVAAVAIVVGGLILDVADDGAETDVPVDQPTTVAAAERVGFVGLPPKGARPTPVLVDAVLDIASCPYEPYGKPSEISGWSGELTVFADGRLIWLQYADVPEGANRLSTGYLEQRLTPEGVELMRSELLASGLLLPEQQDPDHVRCGAGGYHGHLFDPESSYESPANNHFSSPTNEHIDRLTDPASWLPDSAWEDREIKAHVASRYEITLTGQMTPTPRLPRSRLVHVAAQLPAAAAELIRSKDWDYQEAGLFWLYTDFTTEEARALAAALEDARFEQDAQTNAYQLEYHLQYEDLDFDTTVHILFSPVLPRQAE